MLHSEFFIITQRGGGVKSQNEYFCDIILYMQKAELYKNGRGTGTGVKTVQCLACRHYCRISDGGTGVCGVRMNKGGVLGLLVYGKPIAAHLDPIEKKPLYHFLPGSSVFSIGTIGCNFSCKFCQNWDISQVTKEIKANGVLGEKYEEEVEKICRDGMGSRWGEGGREKHDDEWLSPEKAVETCVSLKAAGSGTAGAVCSIAYTYNEPTIFIEYARDIGVLARAAGIKNVLVTNGYESPECLGFCRGWVDAMNIDLKAFKEATYSGVCGAGGVAGAGVARGLKGVLNTIEKSLTMGIWVELTTLVIPGMNDSSEELREIAKFIAGLSVDIPWHVTAFYPCYKMMDREPTPESALLRAWEIGRAAGLRYVYMGNIFGGHHATVCPKCGFAVVERSGMGCERNKIKNEKCPKCGEKIAGVWG